MSAGGPFDLAIVIPFHGRTQKLEELLVSLERAVRPEARIELVVADDTASPLLADRLEQFSRDTGWEAKHIILPPSCVARARNEGVRATSAPLILFLDDDVRADANLLVEHLRFHSTEPRAVCLGRTAFPPDEKPDYLARYFDVAGYFEKIKFSDKLSFIQFITSNLSLARRYFEEAGGFDERFERYGHEDLELGYRLTKKVGLEIRYCPGAIVYHYHRRTIEEFARIKKDIGWSSVLFDELHPHARNEISFLIDEVLNDFDEAATRLEEEDIASWFEFIRTVEAGVREGKYTEEFLKCEYEKIGKYFEKRGIIEQLTGRLLKISIVLLARNRGGSIFRTVGSIVRAPYPQHMLEIIIYDPASIISSEHMSMLRNLAGDIKIEHIRSNEKALKKYLISSSLIPDAIAFLDDSLAVSGSWPYRISLLLGKGEGKIAGVTLPDTITGRFAGHNPSCIEALSIEGEEINICYARKTFFGKGSTGSPAVKRKELIAYKRVPRFYTNSLVRLFSLIYHIRKIPRPPAIPSPSFWKTALFFLSFGKIPVHIWRFFRKGYPLADCLGFPLLEKLIYMAAYFKKK